MKTYTAPQMLAIWRRALNIDTTPAGASLTLFEGIDTDAIITRHMRAWYLNLLDTADPCRLPVSDIARTATLNTTADNHATVTLPAGVRRVIAIRLHGWATTVAPLHHTDPCARRLLARLASPYARPGTCRPLAITIPGSIFVMPVTLPAILTLRAVIDPGPDTYTLDESLLSTIPTNI